MDSTQIATPPYYFRWLNGDEYEDILNNYTEYSIPIVSEHPEEIYYEPKNGYMYFLKNTTLKNLGFPRLKDNSKKLFKWKKMNFQTPLPKHSPKVSYIVCSTTSQQDQPHFRMHIVQLFEHRDEEGLLLCHLLQICTHSPSSPQINEYITPKISEVPSLTYEECEEIRHSQQKLVKCIQKSQMVINRIEELQLYLNLATDDHKYIIQKLLTEDERERNSILYSEVMSKFNLYLGILQESQGVIERYDDL